MPKRDVCPKCAHAEIVLRYDPGPPEQLHVECSVCGFVGLRPCADAGGDVVEKIQRAVSHYYGVTVGDLLSYDRHKTLAEARHVACYLARTLPDPHPSYPELGRRFGNRDHTTIMQSCKRGEEIVAKNESLRSILVVDADVPAEQLLLPGLAKTIPLSRRVRVA